MNLNYNGNNKVITSSSTTRNDNFSFRGNMIDDSDENSNDDKSNDNYEKINKKVGDIEEEIIAAEKYFIRKQFLKSNEYANKVLLVQTPGNYVNVVDDYNKHHTKQQQHQRQTMKNDTEGVVTNFQYNYYYHNEQERDNASSSSSHCHYKLKFDTTLTKVTVFDRASAILLQSIVEITKDSKNDNDETNLLSIKRLLSYYSCIHMPLPLILMFIQYLIHLSDRNSAFIIGNKTLWKTKKRNHQQNTHDFDNTKHNNEEEEEEELVMLRNELLWTLVTDVLPYYDSSNNDNKINFVSSLLSAKIFDDDDSKNYNYNNMHWLDKPTHKSIQYVRELLWGIEDNNHFYFSQKCLKKCQIEIENQLEQRQLEEEKDASMLLDENKNVTISDFLINNNNFIIKKKKNENSLSSWKLLLPPKKFIQKIHKLMVSFWSKYYHCNSAKKKEITLILFSAILILCYERRRRKKHLITATTTTTKSLLATLRNKLFL